VGERDHHLGVRIGRERLDQAELDRGEVVEPVDEDRAAAPVRRPLAQRVERVPRVQLVVHEPGAVEHGAVGAVDRGHLGGVRAPRAVAGPGRQRLGEPLRRDHRALELADQPVGGAHEPGPRRRAREHVESGLLDRALGDQLALEARRDPAAERLRAAALGHDLEQPLEAHDARAEHGAALRQLALGVLHVAERGHDEHRLAAQRGAVGAEDDPRLSGVGGPGYQLERHPAHSGPAIRRRARALPAQPATCGSSP
jgi:hypothetical protein